jgi:hypothetical protein
MNTIQNLFQQAQLAEAAYASLATGIGSQSNLLTALNIANKDIYGGSFSQTQATDFAAHYRETKRVRLELISWLFEFHPAG